MNKMLFALSLALILTLTPSANAQSLLIDDVVIKIADIDYEPFPANAGEYIDLFLTIKNEGTETAENLNLELIEEYPFSLDPGQDAVNFWAELKGVSSRAVFYKIRVDSNAIGGKNELKLKYWEGTNPNPSFYNILSIDVFVDSSSILVISEVKPTTLNPGSQVEVVFTLANVGNAAVKNLLFEWDEPNNLILPIGSDNRKYVPLIDVGEDVDVKFMIMADPNLAPGVYPLTLKLTDSGNSTITKIGMIVGGGTDFDVTADSVGGEISLSISNIGVNNAESVSVKLGSETEILGNLNKGDFTLATFSNPGSIGPSEDSGERLGTTGQFVNRFRRGNQSESGNLAVEISYTDTTGQRQTITKSITSIPRSASSFGEASHEGGNSGSFSGQFVGRNGGNPLGTVAIVAVVAVVIAGGFYFYRKRKRVEDEV